MKHLPALILTVCFFAIPAKGADENPFHANMILFVKDGQEVPKGYEARLQSLGLRTEAFFAKWMKHWGHPLERTEIFSRSDDNKIKITLIRGNVSGTGGRAALPELRQQALNSAAKKLKHKREIPATWWIFYHAEGVKGFQGGGGPKGGVAINAYPEGEGAIPIDAELSSPALDAVALKGAVHEFGHALGLPHLGARPKLKLGNSLMGPINRAYWRKIPGQDPRVHLNEASAAMLKSHPIFRKDLPNSPTKTPPDLTISDLKAVAQGKSIKVTGTLKSSEGAHSVIIADSERNKFGDYWARAYTAKLSEKGEFSIIIDELHKSGTLFVGFCFNNGTNSGGSGKSYQAGSPVTVTYEETKEGFEIKTFTNKP